MKTPERVHDKRTTKLENVMAQDYIPFLEGRPSREEAIKKDDLLDLKILLNQTHSIEEFISSI